MGTLQGKIALVTGGNRGIGAACSLELAKAGCDVAVNFHQRAVDAEAVRAEIQKLGRRAVVVQADVSRSEQVKQWSSKSKRTSDQWTFW